GDREPARERALARRRQARGARGARLHRSHRRRRARVCFRNTEWQRLHPEAHSMNTTMIFRNAALIALGGLTAWDAQAQERIAVPLSDAARPAVLEVDAFGTAINVNAYDGKEVVIVARENTAKEAEDDDDPRVPGPRPRPPRERGKADGDDEASTAGLHRIPNTSIGLTATEENNLVTVKTDFPRQRLALDISVPRNTSVHLKTVNGGEVTITGVRGEHELSNTNGRVVANDIGGSLVASSTNGTIRATFT